MVNLVADQLADLMNYTISSDLIEHAKSKTRPQVIGDIWRISESQRILGIDYVDTMDWYNWLNNVVRPSLLTSTILQNISEMVQKDAKLIDRLANDPPSLPNIGGFLPQHPGDDFKVWVLDRLIIPILARVFYGQTLPLTDDISDNTRECYNNWLHHKIKRFHIAPISFFSAPPSLYLQLDPELLIRPIDRLDVQALLSSIHPLATVCSPNDLISPTHVIEYRPKDELDLSSKEYQYHKGILRAITSLRLLQRSGVGIPFIVDMTDIPQKMHAGAVSHKNDSSVLGYLSWNNCYLIEVHQIYNALGEKAAYEPLRTALRWWDASLQQMYAPDCLLAAWVALEAFLGESSSNQQLRFRMALRGSLYLEESSPKERIKWYHALLSSYDSRSNVVHGTKLWQKKSKDMAKLMEDQRQASIALHLILRRALLNPPKWQMKDAEEELLKLYNKVRKFRIRKTSKE